MPYSIQKDTRCPAGKPWAVVNEQTKDLRGCHPTKARAREQQKALYANVPDARPPARANLEPEDATDFYYPVDSLIREGSQNG